VWVTAAVCMRGGAAMPIIAAITVALYLFAVTALTALIRRLPRQHGTEIYPVRYTDGGGALRDILQVASNKGYDVALSPTRRERAARGRGVEATSAFRPRKRTQT